MMPIDTDWAAQVVGWAVVWIAVGMAAREALQQREEREQREGRSMAHEEHR